MNYELRELHEFIEKLNYELRELHEFKEKLNYELRELREFKEKVNYEFYPAMIKDHFAGYTNYAGFKHIFYIAC